ncbi:MAG: efflux RND transporter periplasmic adaptor subunit [bacterium]
MLKKSYFKPYFIIFLLLLMLLFFFSSFLASCSKEQRTRKMKSEVETVTVLVKKSYFGSLDTFLEIDAKIDYKTISNVAFQVGGRVDKVYVDEGDFVRKGQIIASLDKYSYNQQLEQANQAVMTAKANYDQALYNFKIQKAQIESDFEKATLLVKQYKENLKLAETLLYQAKKDFERYSKLYEEGVVPSQQFENVKIQYQNSLTNYYNSKLALKQAEENLSIASLKKERLAVFENQLKAAYSQYLASVKNYNLIKENLKYTDLQSPVDGEILKKNVEIGSVVNPGLIAFVIGDPKTKIVKASVSDIDSKKIKLPSPAIVTFKNKEYKVMVNKIYPNLNSIGQNYVEAYFVDNNNELSYNDYVNLKILKKSVKGIIVLRQAITYEESGAYVFIVENNVAIKKKVKIIENYGDLAVVEGIENNQYVVIDGQYFINEGDMVKVVEK